MNEMEKIAVERVKEQLSVTVKRVIIIARLEETVGYTLQIKSLDGQEGEYQLLSGETFTIAGNLYDAVIKVQPHIKPPRTLYDDKHDIVTMLAALQRIEETYGNQLAIRSLLNNIRARNLGDITKLEMEQENRYNYD